MKMIRRAFVAAAFAVALSGCASGGLVEPGPTQAGAGAFTVTPTRQWSDLTFLLNPRPPGVRMLSIDGPFLNRLYLAEIQSGQSLVRPADRDTPRPLYRTDLTDTELVEFVIDCIAVEYQSPTATALRPQMFAGRPGVRFDIETLTARGLRVSGTALVSRNGDRLQVMLYLAPSEHYYAELLPEVERIFASAATP